MGNLRHRFYQLPSVPPTGYLPYIYRYDVVEREVHAVLAHAGEDFPAFGGARMALGQIEPGGRYLRVIYVPDPGTGSLLILVAFTLRGKVLSACRDRQRSRGQHHRILVAAPIAEAPQMAQQCLPLGWDEEAVQRVIAHYENLGEDEQLAEDEAVDREAVLGRVRELVRSRRVVAEVVAGIIRAVDAATIHEVMLLVPPLIRNEIRQEIESRPRTEEGWAGVRTYFLGGFVPVHPLTRDELRAVYEPRVPSAETLRQLRAETDLFRRYFAEVGSAEPAAAPDPAAG